MSKHTFLFELGVEELPPAYVTTYAKQFNEHLAAQFQANALTIKTEDYQLVATPRRLGFVLTLHQDNQQQQLIADATKGERIENGVLISKRVGPKVKSLNDKPAVGFAKSCGLAVEALQQDTEGRVYCDMTITAKPTVTLLPKVITAAFESFNKTVGMRFMRWGNKDVMFVRPVRWLVCMCDNDVIDMTWLGLTAAKQSSGHRFHGEPKVNFEHAADYLTIMQQQFVMPNYVERKTLIRQQLDTLAAKTDSAVVIQEDLLDEVTAINEWPKAVLCQFEDAFLQVPQEALIESMQSHQKSFALKDKAGKLRPNFITISNIATKQEASLIKGNEKVMTARLADARFFYETDIKVSLEQLNEKNKTVTFQKKLGSIWDKTQRVCKLANHIAQLINANETIVNRAATLANADLNALMVYEFPELQGIMGKYYALHQGEDSLVANCIEQRYWPRFAGDKIPASNEAACLALADRIDTLIGIFGLGLKPTGSKDPYSLRRAAIGIIHIIQERQLAVSLETLLVESLKTFTNGEVTASAAEEVQEYILKRLEDIYIKEYQHDKRALQILRAVLACQRHDILDIDVRFKALQQFIDLPELATLAEANKRVKNLLQKVESVIPECKQALLVEADEVALIKAYADIKQALDQTDDYIEKFKCLCRFAKPLSAFFDTVMVMVEDEAIKFNRLALLKQIANLFHGLADISYLS